MHCSIEHPYYLGELSFWGQSKKMRNILNFIQKQVVWATGRLHVPGSIESLMKVLFWINLWMFRKAQLDSQ